MRMRVFEIVLYLGYMRDPGSWFHLARHAIYDSKKYYSKISGPG